MLIKRIDDLCALKNISRTKLEEILGFSKSSISKWDKSSPSIDKLSKVADYFNITVDELMGKQNNDIDDEILLLARQADKLTTEEKRMLIDHFKNTMSIYLKK